MNVVVLRIRFDTNQDPSSVWPDELTENWMQPLREYSLAHFWWLSTGGLITVEHTSYPAFVMTDPRRPEQDNNAKRQALIDGAVAASGLTREQWEVADILLLWFAQPTDMFGGGGAKVPRRDAPDNWIPVSVVDVASAFVDCCQELGHSLGFKHEVDARGGQYASPYSCMSSRTSTALALRPHVDGLPDGAPHPDPSDPETYGQPAQHIVGSMITAMQLLVTPGFRGSSRVVELADAVRQGPQRVRLYTPDYDARLPEPATRLVTFLSPTGDGRLYGVEFRRGGKGYEAGIGTRAPAGLVVHSINRDGRVRYDGVAPLASYAEQRDRAIVAGGFTLRYRYVPADRDFVDVEVRPGTYESFPIRGVLLLGGFRTQAELNKMSHDDMRNTLIVELTGRTADQDYQRYDNDELAGIGGILVAMRRARVRDDVTLRTMTADGMRNTFIVELDAQTGAGQRLQGFTNLELVEILLGSDLAWRGIDVGAIDRWVRGVLLIGRFRSQQELNAMSPEDMRNTLIVELTGRTKQADYQAWSTPDLAGAGAVMVAMRELGIRTDDQLRTMSADDLRNTLIVELDAQAHRGTGLQALSNLDLALVALGVERVT